MVKTISELKAQSAEVKNASAIGENTATRVGQLFGDIVEHVEQYENTKDGKDASQDAQMQSLVSAEENRAKGEERGLQNQIHAEKIDRQTADTYLGNLIQQESSARETADENIRTALANETARAQAAEQELAAAQIYTSKIKDGAVTTPKIADGAVTYEKTDIIAQELGTNMTKVPSQKVVTDAIQKEETERKADIDGLTVALGSETIHREQADEAESNRAKGEERGLQNEIHAEKIDRKTADTYLSNLIQQETERAMAAEEANAQAIADETARAKAAEEAIIFDVSSNNNGAVFESLQALLSSSNLSTLIPTSVRYGGMSIRFVQSSDNKYVQYRLMAQNFTTDVTQWQGVDDEPTAGSNNLVKSGGVYKLESSITGVLVDKTFNEINLNNRVTAFVDVYTVGVYHIEIKNIVLPNNAKYRCDLKSEKTAYSAGAIKAIKGATSNTEDLSIDFELTETYIAQGAKYIAVICETADEMASFHVSVGLKGSLSEVIDIHSNDIVSLKNSQRELAKNVLSIKNTIYGSSMTPFDYDVQYDDSYCKTYRGTYGISKGYCITKSISLTKGTKIRITTSGYGVGLICVDYGGGDYEPLLNAQKERPAEPILYEYEFVEDYDAIAFCGLKADLSIEVDFIEDGLVQELQQVDLNLQNLDVRVTNLENKEYITNDNQSLLLRHLIPSYYYKTPDELSEHSNEYLDGKASEVHGDNKLIFVTDVHWNSNKKHSPLLIKYIKDKIGCENILFGGDVIGVDLSVNKTMLDARVFMNEWLSAFDSSLLFGIGDHDLNTGSIEWNQKMSYQTAMDIYLQKLKDKVTFDTILINKVELDSEVVSWGNNSDAEIAYLGGVDEFKSWLHFHYSFDDNKNKIRYIVLNTGGPHTYYVNNKLKIGDSGYENNDLYLQMDFLYNQLMTLPDGYSVVVLGHRFIHYRHDFQVYGVMLEVAKMLSAFKMKTTTSIDCPLTRTPNWYANGVHAYNFSNAPTSSKIIALCGDTHHDSSCITHTKNDNYISESYVDGMEIGADGILFINTHCDAFEGADPDTGGNETKAPMEENTITEQAFDIVSWDSRHVYCTRIGAGDNRTFNY